MAEKLGRTRADDERILRWLCWRDRGLTQGAIAKRDGGTDKIRVKKVLQRIRVDLKASEDSR